MESINRALTSRTYNSTIFSIIKGAIIMVKIITANELKIRGVSAFDTAASGDTESAITVRGKMKYIVLPIETYNYLRECELESALEESKKDLKSGNFVEESVEDHIKRITNG